MTSKDKIFRIRSKIWIEDGQGNVIFGLGRFRMLNAIDRCGSINAASKELKMSYRAIWGKIKTTEEALGQPLLVKNTGGSAGGGSVLTPLAISLLERFRFIHSQVNEQSDLYFDEQFAPRLQPENNL